MEEDAQQFPDYDGNFQETSPSEFPQGTNKKKRKSGRLSKEGERRKKQRWRSKNSGRYNAYMKAYMARKRSGGLASGD